MKRKGTPSKLTPPTITKTGTTAGKSTLPGPVKSTHHKSAVSLSSRPVSAVTRARVMTSTVRRPHRVLDVNKKRDKPAGVHGALLLVKDLNVTGYVVLDEDFLFDL